MAQATLIQDPAPFSFTTAERVATPLLMALVGPSGTGKTYSALRLATGMRRVTGGDIAVIDTESGRALHYAPLPGQKADPSRGTFEFKHLPLTSPFGSLRYLEAIQFCVKNGAKTIIVDSMSHEHEGVGGVLEQHAAEAERLAKEYKSTVDAMKMSAWGPPKMARKKLINTILTDLSVSCIFCFRAKNKTKVATKEEKKNGADPVSQAGYLPIAGEEFIFEMMVKAVLLPGARGVPTWKSDKPAEQEMMKIPEQFMHVFERPAPLSEEIGQQLAEWAAGGESKTPSEADLAAGLAKVKAAVDLGGVEAAAEEMRGKPWTTAQRRAIKQAVDGRKAELAKA